MNKFLKSLFFSLLILIIAVPLNIFACEGDGEDGVGYYEQLAGEYLHSRSVLHDPSENGFDLTVSVKKEEAIVVMSRLLKEQDKAKNYPTTRMTFTDVPKNSEFAPYIAWAKEKGIIKVASDKKFGFGKQLKVKEAEELILRALGYKNITNNDMDKKSKDLGIVQGSVYQWVNTSDSNVEWGDFALFIYNSLYASKADGTVFGEAVRMFDKIDGNGTSTSNVSNGGYFAKYGDWIYFSNFSDKQSIYKMRTDGTGKVKLNYNESSKIYVVDNWIYYLKNSYSQWYTPDYSYNYVYKMRTDGQMETRVTDQNNRDLIIYDGWIYSSNAKDMGKLYKIKLDGTQKIKLSDDVASNISVENGWVYYYNNGYMPGVWYTSGPNSTAGIYRVRTDGTEKERLIRENGQLMSVVDGWVYYTTSASGNKLYKMTADGKQKSWVGEIKADSFNVSGEWVYYSNKDDANKLYKTKLDGTGKTKLSDMQAKSINVLDDAVYFYSRIEKGKPGAGFAVQYRINVDGTGLQKLEEQKPTIEALLKRASADKSSMEFNEGYTYAVSDAFRQNVPTFTSELSKLPKEKQDTIINILVTSMGLDNYIAGEYLKNNRNSAWLTDDEAQIVDSLISEMDKYDSKYKIELNTSTTIDDIQFTTSPLVEGNKAVVNVTVRNDDISTDRKYSVDITLDKSVIPMGYSGYAEVKIPQGETTAVANITVTLPQAGSYYTRVRVFRNDRDNYGYAADRVGRKPDTIFNKLIIE